MQHFRRLLPNKWQRPRKHVHKVRQPVRVCGMRKFLNIHGIVRIDHDCSFVAIDVKVIWRRKNGDHGRKPCFGICLVHAVALSQQYQEGKKQTHRCQMKIERRVDKEKFTDLCFSLSIPLSTRLASYLILCFMSTDHRQQIISIEEITCCFVCEDVWAPACFIV